MRRRKKICCLSAGRFRSQTTKEIQVIGLWVLIALSGAYAATPPKPFTPIEASAHEFRCLGRKVQLGDMLLPKQIVAAEQALLASPIRLIAEPAILERLKTKAKLVKNDGVSAEWVCNGDSDECSLVEKLTADCDGFCWYEMTLTPKRPLRLGALRIEIPRVKATARYLHTAEYDWSNVSGGLPEMGGKWSGQFVPYVWLGDEERGLAWCAESNEGWLLIEPRHAVEVETRGEVVCFKTRYLDHQETISAPLVIRFGLQPGPVKPVSFAWRASARILHDIHYDSCRPGTNGECELDAIAKGGAKTVVIHDSWTSYFGQMVPADAARFRELIDACHHRGLRLLVYVGYGVARNAPEMKGHHDEWSVLPLIPWDPGYKPRERGFDATCAKSGWADWLVAGAEKLFSEFDLDGLYFDGTSEAWRCQNTVHGCGWKDASGAVHPVYPILAARQLMRRMAATVRRHKPDAILDVHMSSNLTLPTLSFCDSLWNGEQFEGHTSGEKFQVPLHVFRTEFMGYAHGMDMEFLCYENRPFTFDEAVALAWLHGVEVRPYPKTLSKITPLWRAMDNFGVTKAKWQPYWKGSGATSPTPSVQISAWTRKSKALLFVSHLQRTNETVRIALDEKRLGVTLKSSEARDVLSGESLAVRNGTIDIPFSGMSYRMVAVGPAKANRHSNH